MTALLRPGDKIILAVPDFYPLNTVTNDATYWGAVYGRLGVEIHHLSVSPTLTHPVVVAVFRDDAERADHEAP